MPRVKRGNHRRLKRKRILSKAKGYYQAKSKLYRYAREAVDRAEKFGDRLGGRKPSLFSRSAIAPSVACWSSSDLMCAISSSKYDSCSYVCTGRRSV